MRDVDHHNARQAHVYVVNSRWLIPANTWREDRILRLDGFVVHRTLRHTSDIEPDWVVSLIWMSHVSHMNESCFAYEWVMSLIWMSHVSHMNESCLAYEWVMSLIWMSHVSHMNESCLAYEWVMSLIWMSHVSPMNESYLAWTKTQGMTHSYARHDWMSFVTRYSTKGRNRVGFFLFFLGIHHI